MSGSPSVVHEFAVVDVMSAARIKKWTLTQTLSVEVWTPLIVGAVGCRMHFRSSTSFKKLTENYLHYLVSA